MSTNHTPGPWEVVQPHTEANRSEHIEIEDGFGRTATVYGEPDDSETQATARLIAAAPELLAALQVLHLAVLGDPTHGGLSFRYRGAMDKARAAIAKAGGGA